MGMGITAKDIDKVQQINGHSTAIQTYVWKFVIIPASLHMISGNATLLLYGHE